MKMGMKKWKEELNHKQSHKWKQRVETRLAKIQNQKHGENCKIMRKYCGNRKNILKHLFKSKKH